MSDDGHTELYVYWKLAPARRAEALAAVRAFQAQLAAAGVPARLLQRTDDRGAAAAGVTVMETYGVGRGLDPALAAAIVRDSQAALADWAEGPRHVERFAPCPLAGG